MLVCVMNLALSLNRWNGIAGLMKAYVISLARSADRRAHMVRQLSKAQLSYEFIRATDWREADLGDTQLFEPRWMAEETRGGMSPGSAAAALSHLDACRRILADGPPCALVMEDDIVLPAGIGELADAIEPHLTGAEVVLLNFHSVLLTSDSPDRMFWNGKVLNTGNGPCQVIREGSVQLPHSRLLAQIVEPCLPSSGACYLITREACERRVRTGLPVRGFPDSWSMFYWDGIIDRVRCVTPMPVPNSPDFRTTIDRYQPNSIQARMREFVARSKTPIVYQALALRRKRTFRRLGWAGVVNFVDDVPGSPPATVYWRNPQRPVDLTKAVASPKRH